MNRTETIIDLHRNDMKFSVAHFTIFSPTIREKIHGHNYYLRTKITAGISSLGLAFDYREVRKILIKKCNFLNENFLLPSCSPYLSIDKMLGEKSLKVTFNHETMILLEKDVLLLPLVNISSESLSSWFLSHLTANDLYLKEKNISKIEIIISTTLGHGCSTFWSNNAENISHNRC